MLQDILTTEKRRAVGKKDVLLINKRENASTELEPFKTNINLVEFAINQFGYTVDVVRSSPNSIVLRKGEAEKLIVTRDVDGHYVYFAPITSYQNDWGSIIDFIQARQRVTLGQVRVILRSYQGTSSPHLPEKTARLYQKIKPVPQNTLAVIKAYERMSVLASYLILRISKVEGFQKKSTPIADLHQRSALMKAAT